MAIDTKFTSEDLALMPDDGKRYEIIDGELYVSKQPSWHHQFACVRLARFLDEWNERTGLGMVNFALGVIFAEDDDVAPDIVWISRERLATALDEAGHLSAAPEIVIEVLSPGAANERRDRQTKLKLYARRAGVLDCGLDAAASGSASSQAWRTEAHRDASSAGRAGVAVAAGLLVPGGGAVCRAFSAKRAGMMPVKPIVSCSDWFGEDQQLTVHFFP